MTVADTIRQHAEAEARRIAHERGDDGADIPHMAAALIHKEMMRQLEPYHRMKSRVMSTIMTPGYYVRSDGGLAPIPPVIPEVLRPGLAALDEQIDTIHSVYQQAMQQFTELPRRGTPAAELTDRDKLALAIAAGVPVQTCMEGMQLTVKALRSIGVADRGDGGYIVATGPL